MHIFAEKAEYNYWKVKKPFSHDYLRILDDLTCRLFHSPLPLSFPPSRFLFLLVSFFLINTLLQAWSAPPARHRLGRRVSNSRQGAERNGKQRARFSEIMYAASVENLGRLCTRAILFSPLLIPSHPFSRRIALPRVRAPDAVRPSNSARNWIFSAKSSVRCEKGD